MTSMNKQMDVFARLLATENITIQRAKVSTASFALKERILTLPTWKEMDPVTEQMLIIHEVGHAIASNQDEFDEIFGGKLAYLKSYVNIIEDARIERIMKAKYPGSKRVFFEGYKNLLAKDFFGLSQHNVNKMMFADRLNLYFKCGSLVDVQFTNDELAFIRQVEVVKSVQEVIVLAEELYKMCKCEPSNQDDDTDFSSVSDDDEDFSFDPEEDKEDEEDEENEEADEPITDSYFSQRLEDQCDMETEYRYFEPVFEFLYDHDNIVPFDKVLTDFCDHLEYQLSVKFNRPEYEAFANGTKLTVSYLVKEFEMKKAATAYRRQQTSKTGSIDARKLFKYQLSDDIFRQITITKGDTRHSMTFLLDWSGSMYTCMKETIEQLIGLVSFCRQIHIPFNVFAFSDSYYENRPTQSDIPKHNVNGLNRNNTVSLIQLFSDKMSIGQFNEMCESLCSCPWDRVPNYMLSGTPLNAALIYCIDYLGKFLNSVGTEKNTFILLTDGAGESVRNSTCDPVIGRTYNTLTNKTVNRKSFLRDPVTKREYPITRYEPIGATNALLDIIRHRYNMKVIRFFVTQNSASKISSFLHNNGIEIGRSEIEGFVKKMRRDDYLQIDGIPGADKMFLIRSNTKVTDTELTVDSSMSASKLSTQLKSSMKTSRTSRVLLSRFIDEIA